MEPLVGAILIGLPALWLVGMAGYAYRDAARHGMNPKKWAAISLAVPFFGFSAYLFERDERDYDPREDPYARGPFNVHESRNGDAPGVTGGGADDAADEDRRGRGR